MSIKFDVFFKMVMSVLFVISANIALCEKPDAYEVMRLVDENQHIVSARMEAEMIIENRGRRMTKQMLSYVRTIDGESEALTEFLNPRDRGTKYLKLADDLWMFFPDAEELVKISGHMLRQGMMGSDFSYEDILESDQLTQLYDFEIVAKESIDDRQAYVINAVAKPDESPTYHIRKIWVDAQRYIVLKEQLFSSSSRLLKELTTVDARQFGERWLPIEQIMQDKLRRNTQTTFKISEIILDYQIPEGTISLDALQ